eukprot:170887_1
MSSRKDKIMVTAKKHTTSIRYRKLEMIMSGPQPCRKGARNATMAKEVTLTISRSNTAVTADIRSKLHEETKKLIMSAREKRNNALNKKQCLEQELSLLLKENYLHQSSDENVLHREIRVDVTKRKQDKIVQLRREIHVAEMIVAEMYYKAMNTDTHTINNRYVLMNKIDDMVYRGFDLQTHKYIAAKVRKSNDNDKWMREYQFYIDTALDLDHPNVVSVHCVLSMGKTTFCKVSELCNGMNLQMHLRQNHDKLSEQEAQIIGIQIFNGLQYLHNGPGIVHCNLKPTNVLFHRDGILPHIKLCDCALNTQHMMDRKTEHILYLPPESLDTNRKTGSVPPYSPSIDIWSTGVLMYKMLFGSLPFELMSEIVNARHVTFPQNISDVSDAAKRFVSACCAHDPQQRPSSNYIVDYHDYFSFLRN